MNPPPTRAPDSSGSHRDPPTRASARVLHLFAPVRRKDADQRAAGPYMKLDRRCFPSGRASLVVELSRCPKSGCTLHLLRLPAYGSPTSMKWGFLLVRHVVSSDEPLSDGVAGSWVSRSLLERPLLAAQGALDEEGLAVTSGLEDAY